MMFFINLLEHNLWQEQGQVDTWLHDIILWWWFPAIIMGTFIFLCTLQLAPCEVLKLPQPQKTTTTTSESIIIVICF